MARETSWDVEQIGFNPEVCLTERAVLHAKYERQVEDLQPFYVWNRRRIDDLRIGAAILKEALQRESAKIERDLKTKQQEKAAVEAEKLQVCSRPSSE